MPKQESATAWKAWRAHESLPVRELSIDVDRLISRMVSGSAVHLDQSRQFISESEAAMRIALYEKPLDIRLSRSAEAALSRHTGTLLAEMELIFGCMIRKSVVFREWDADVEVDAIETDSGLAVRFAPLMTRAACAATVNDHDLEEGSPTLATRYRLDNPSPFVPRWLAVDYRQGQWHGEFGYGEQVGA